MLAATINAGLAANSVSQQDKNDLGQKDIFLKLLVAQMENQDPLKPQDATQMSSQLAQFNMVEQQTESNKFLQQLVENGLGGNGGGGSPVGLAGNGASYLGHPVTVNDNGIYYDGTNQSFSVKLDQAAKDALIFITDSAGNPVRTLKLSNLNAGGNPMLWDGKTDSGAIAAQGDYSIEVSATDIDGADVGFVVQRDGQVNAVRFGASGTEIMVGGVAVPIADITEIRL